MAAQAIPSYAPMQAMAHFNKIECFCFNEYTLRAGESKQWPVVFYVDPKLPKDVTTITLSYTFFEVGGKVPAAPVAPRAAAAVAAGADRS
jgi:cytochrome c oxidase assembly protein subunit 11